MENEIYNAAPDEAQGSLGRAWTWTYQTNTETPGREKEEDSEFRLQRIQSNGTLENINGDESRESTVESSEKDEYRRQKNGPETIHKT